MSGLGVTDGTASGTHELVAGAGGASDLFGLNPTNLTVYNGEVLFSGLDASGDMGLWMTNGTAAGTHELTGITGADPSGLAPSDLMVYNGEVLFRGLDQLGRPAVDDERDRGRNARVDRHRRSGDDRSRIGPDYFERFNGVVLFNGIDSHGHPNCGRRTARLQGQRK